MDLWRLQIRNDLREAAIYAAHPEWVLEVERQVALGWHGSPRADRVAELHCRACTATDPAVALAYHHLASLELAGWRVDVPDAIG